jgi:cytoskeleton protein RodZ
LFEDPLGLRLKHAREKAGISKETAAQKLKFPLSVVEAIEKEDWLRLGAPIFVRSYVGSYARLLGLPASLAEEAVRDKPAPSLVAVGSGSPAKRMFDRGLMNLAYLVMTIVIAGLAIALAMHFQSTSRPAPTPSLSLESSEPDRGSPRSAVPAPTNAVVMASLSPPIASIAPGENELVLRFRGDSWMEATGPGGVRIDRGLVPAGSERRYDPGKIARIVLGDADQVDVSLGANKVDLARYHDVNDAKVARFAVSSAGTLAAVDD